MTPVPKILSDAPSLSDQPEKPMEIETPSISTVVPCELGVEVCDMLSFFNDTVASCKLVSAKALAAAMRAMLETMDLTTFINTVPEVRIVNITYLLAFIVPFCKCLIFIFILLFLFPDVKKTDRSYLSVLVFGLCL